MSFPDSCALIDINDELSHYPNKVADPFSRLLYKGVLTEGDAQIILGAGKTCDRPTTLLGFACIFMASGAQQERIREGVNAALFLKARLDLGWEKQKLLGAIDRLVRRARLTQIAHSDAPLDIEQITSRIEQPIQGEWIRSRLRLGIEEMRQRQTLHGRAEAFASVIVDRTRWTVGLSYYPHTNAPMMAVAVTRSNKTLNNTLVERLCAALNLPLRATRHLDWGHERRTVDEDFELLRAIVSRAKKSGITRIETKFYGDYDEGLIEEAEMTLRDSHASITHNSVPCKIRQSTIHQVSEGLEIVESLDELTISDAMKELVNTMGERSMVYWAGNDYSGGEITLCVNAGLVCVTVWESEDDEFNVTCQRFDMQTGELIQPGLTQTG